MSNSDIAGAIIANICLYCTAAYLINDFFKEKKINKTLARIICLTPGINLILCLAGLFCFMVFILAMIFIIMPIAEVFESQRDKNSPRF